MPAGYTEKNIKKLWPDLKLCASSSNAAKEQLEVLLAFTKDIGMAFKNDKYSYQQIQNGKPLQCINNLEINHLSIKPMREGDT